MTDLQTAQPKPTEVLRQQLDKLTPQFALALPEHVTPEKFVRVVMTAAQSNPDLLNADRQTFFSAAMKCAQDGLLPDGREAALVIFNTKVKDQWVKAVQFMPMTAGILSKVRRSGELSTLAAHVVFKKDMFVYVLGDEERIEHSPCLEEDRGEPIAVYAIAKTKDGGIYREVMSVADVTKVRNISRSKDKGPWVDWWDEMAKKSVIRRLSKRLPMSTDLRTVIERDDELYDLKLAQLAERPSNGLRERLEARGRAAEGFTTATAISAPEEPEEAVYEAADAQAQEEATEDGEVMDEALVQRVEVYSAELDMAKSTDRLKKLHAKADDIRKALEPFPLTASVLEARFNKRWAEVEEIEKAGV